MIKIVIDDKIPYIQGVFEPYAKVVYAPGAKIDAAMVKDADALVIRTRTHCNKELLDGSSVKMIATATIGYDHIDRDYCQQNNIQWQNAPGCNSWSVAQYMAAFFASYSLTKQDDVKGKTLGVVGLGNVGSKVARYAQLLGMSVLVNDPPLQESGVKEDFVSLDTIQREADIITFHVPLTRDGKYPTYHMADAAFFDGCQRKPVVCNTCRGEVFLTEDLKQALDCGLVSDVVIDCWEHEPNIDADLLACSLVTTPHIAGYSRDGKAKGTAMSVENIARFFDIPLHGWWPSDIEKPAVANIDLTGLPTREAIWKAIMHTYPIEKETSLLKSSPETFENQRGDYPLRREYPAYSIHGASDEVNEILQKMNFQIG